MSLNHLKPDVFEIIYGFLNAKNSYQMKSKYIIKQLVTMILLLCMYMYVLQMWLLAK